MMTFQTKPNHISYYSDGSAAQNKNRISSVWVAMSILVWLLNGTFMQHATGKAHPML
jgi:hypothetical protein